MLLKTIKKLILLTIILLVNQSLQAQELAGIWKGYFNDETPFPIQDKWSITFKIVWEKDSTYSITTYTPHYRVPDSITATYAIIKIIGKKIEVEEIFTEISNPYPETYQKFDLRLQRKNNINSLIGTWCYARDKKQRPIGGIHLRQEKTE